jgi:thiol-disulfide isomerase/thioredoxin
MKMKTINQQARLLTICLLLTTVSPGLFAQASQKAVVVASESELAAMRTAIEKSPDSLAYHTEYIKAVGIDNPELTKQYDKWIEKFSKSATVPFAIGSALYRKEYPAARPYLLKAVERDPRLAQAWQMLSIDASRWGDEKAAAEFMHKATEADPADPGYAFYNAMNFEEIDPARWRAELYKLAKRFPDHERGAQGLYWLATRSTDMKEKIRVYEMLHQLYPPTKFSWSSSGMSGLFDAYLQTDPSKARQLAKEMGEERGWPARDTLAQQFIEVQSLLKNKRSKEALAVAEKMKAPRYTSASDEIALLKAKAAVAAGNTLKAYNDLLKIFAFAPGDDLYKAMLEYASVLGKDKATINKDVWALREEKIKPAPPFELGLYTSKHKASLEDYRGKVVLLTFWFPGCGPCRGEFPHFENVLRKFDKKEVAYLAINIFPEQDEYVPSFMQGTRYSFTPLRSNSEWAEKVYKVRGAPTNFLIDQQGNIVFTSFRAHDRKTERMMELMIQSMLDRKAGSRDAARR